ncbi:His Kinase A (phospho-acceptor) domain-containing protein [Filimonas lacunae]|uniref:histidine kinase n=1 Tax=Filimonas lacunae TaxID=477680 RepID=A0A173MKU5_9BACT|nr:HAMP domain-containing sensor histidine kinase [Filimonas lacunae]BAV08018.1 two-component sensor histidine kinase [Filimonas lacunae]SIT08030.1 His Kinase A (phospho-acceptor) domain-containing protein [Filimonas lacunae]
MDVKFVNILSHELRSPLTTVQTSAEILDHLLSSDIVDTSIMKKHARQIMDEVADMAQLLEKVLVMSRLENTQTGFSPTIADPVTFLEEVLDRPFVCGRYSQKVDFGIKGEHRPALIDPFMLTHIVNGLLDNAFKYSRNKENTVAPRLRLSFEASHWRIMVRDTGIGIKSADKTRLFRSFSRGSNVGHIQGTGLGLEIIKYFVRCHKGAIQLKSIEGKGTVVVVDLPY